MMRGQAPQIFFTRTATGLNVFLNHIIIIIIIIITIIMIFHRDKRRRTRQWSVNGCMDSGLIGLSKSLTPHLTQYRSFRRRDSNGF